MPRHRRAPVQPAGRDGIPAVGTARNPGSARDPRLLGRADPGLRPTSDRAADRRSAPGAGRSLPKRSPPRHIGVSNRLDTSPPRTRVHTTGRLTPERKNPSLCRETFSCHMYNGRRADPMPSPFSLRSTRSVRRWSWARHHTLSIPAGSPAARCALVAGEPQPRRRTPTWQCVRSGARGELDVRAGRRTVRRWRRRGRRARRARGAAGAMPPGCRRAPCLPRRSRTRRR